MKGTAERRIRLLVTLCKRRHDTVYNLAFEFQVNERTIRNDIEVLSTNFPVYTVCGRHGGVFIDEDYRLGMQYLTDREEAFLEKILVTLNGEDKEIMSGVLRKFAKKERKTQ